MGLTGKGEGRNSSKGENQPPNVNGGAGGKPKQPGRARRLVARDPRGSKAKGALKSNPGAGVSGEGETEGWSVRLQVAGVERTPRGHGGLCDDAQLLQHVTGATADPVDSPAAHRLLEVAL